MAWRVGPEIETKRTAFYAVLGSQSARFGENQAFAASGFFQVRFGGLMTKPFLMALAATRM